MNGSTNRALRDGSRNNTRVFSTEKEESSPIARLGFGGKFNRIETTNLKCWNVVRRSRRRISDNGDSMFEGVTLSRDVQLYLHRIALKPLDRVQSLNLGAINILRKILYCSKMSIHVSTE